MYVAIITPYKVAYFDEETMFLKLMDIILDIMFFIDMILSFFGAYFDKHKELVTNRKVISFHNISQKIVINYLKGWFFIDLISVLPLNYILDSGTAGGLARLARLPRLYKLLRLMKLVRMLKVLKEKNKFL